MTRVPRRFVAFVGTVVALLAIIAPAASAAHGDGHGGNDGGNGGGNQDISLTTTALPAMRAGETAWVSTFWNGANFDAHNFKMTATSDDATISYPSNTATYSSLYGSADLLSKSTDFAALKIAVADDAAGSVTVRLHVTYDLDQNNGAHPNPTSKTQDVDVALPVTTYAGAAITPLTTSLGPIAHGTSAWLQFSVRGEKPGISSLSATVSAPTGVSVAYPGGATSTKPSQSSALGVLVSDYFAFDLTVGSIPAGTYNLTITMTYGNSQQQTTVVPVSVT